MLTTAGIAFFAASEKVTTRVGVTPIGGGATDCCIRTTLFDLPAGRGNRSGRSVATTNSAPRHTVHACANSSQNLRSTGKRSRFGNRLDYRRRRWECRRSRSRSGRGFWSQALVLETLFSLFLRRGDQFPYNRSVLQVQQT